MPKVAHILQLDMTFLAGYVDTFINSILFVSLLLWAGFFVVVVVVVVVNLKKKQLISSDLVILSWKHIVYCCGGGSIIYHAKYEGYVCVCVCV